MNATYELAGRIFTVPFLSKTFAKASVSVNQDTLGSFLWSHGVQP